MTDTVEAKRGVAVIGAGAAGLMAALFAQRNGARVKLIETTKDGGRKILISGGGRCNILPVTDAPERFVTGSSKNSLRNILRSWPLRKQRDFFESELRTNLVLEPETGKLFPESNRARDVRDGLFDRVTEAGAAFMPERRVIRIHPPSNDSMGWRVDLKDAPSLAVSAVVLATGGLSVPKTGSDGFGITEARRLGMTVHDPFPALTPLTASPTPHVDLAGISLTVTLRAGGTRSAFSTTGGFLFTHRGYSGPAVLDISHYAVLSPATGPSKQSITVQWTSHDDEGWEKTLLSSRGRVVSVLSQHLPIRLAEQLGNEAGLERGTRTDQLKRAQRRDLINLLTRYELPWTGHEGYKKAEVTGGGVALAEIDPRTMECRRHPGLFLCGELLDAFGPIGGFNFQWGWVTGRAAGLGAAQSVVG